MVRAVAVTPDRRYAASASDDHTRKVWDLKAGDVAAIHSCALAPGDGLGAVHFPRLENVT